MLSKMGHTHTAHPALHMGITLVHTCFLRDATNKPVVADRPAAGARIDAPRCRWRVPALACRPARRGDLTPSRRPAARAIGIVNDCVEDPHGDRRQRDDAGVPGVRRRRRARALSRSRSSWLCRYRRGRECGCGAVLSTVLPDLRSQDPVLPWECPARIAVSPATDARRRARHHGRQRPGIDAGRNRTKSRTKRRPEPDDV
jgi:hypothetical protein